jgi:hypothetical protein
MKIQRKERVRSQGNRLEDSEERGLLDSVDIDVI